MGPSYLKGASAGASDAAMSATALLQKATTIGAYTATQINNNNNSNYYYYSKAASHVSSGFTAADMSTWQKNSVRFTRDFLGLTRDEHHLQHHSNVNENVNVSMDGRDALTCTGGVELQQFERGQPLLNPQGFGFGEPYIGNLG